MPTKKAKEETKAESKATEPETPFAEADPPELLPGEQPLPTPETDAIPGNVTVWVCDVNRALFWPLPGTPPRGGVGTVVRGDDPFVNVRGFPNQFYKLKKVDAKDRKKGFLDLLVGKDEDGEKKYRRVDVTRVTPCESRRMHSEYTKRGITWMPLKVKVMEEVSSIQPREDAAMRLADLAAADEGFDVPPLTE